MADVKTDILVAGAGMVGSTVALGAARLGFDVVLLEPNALQSELPGPVRVLADFDLRVSALTRSSVALLEQLGIWESVADHAQPYRRMDVWDSRGNGRIVFDADDIYQQDLGVIAENRRIVAGLHQKIIETENIRVIRDGLAAWEADTDTDAVVLTTKEEKTIACSLFLGADGANSPSRRLLSLPSREWDYGQEAIVATITTARPHRRVAYQKFLGTGPLALLPLKDGYNSEYYCSVVWSLDVAKVPYYMGLSDQQFSAALGEAADFKLGTVEAVSRRLCFPLRQRHAKQYVTHHSAILGDSAHTIHPLAGQGVNLGFEDVRVMLQELQRARSRGLNPGVAELLRRDQRQRQPANLAMMAAMEGFKRGFGSDAKWLVWLRGQGLNRVNHTLPLKKLLIKHAMGV